MTRKQRFMRTACLGRMRRSGHREETPGEKRFMGAAVQKVNRGQRGVDTRRKEVYGDGRREGERWLAGGDTCNVKWFMGTGTAVLKDDEWPEGGGDTCK